MKNKHFDLFNGESNQINLRDKKRDNLCIRANKNKEYKEIKINKRPSIFDGIAKMIIFGVLFFGLLLSSNGISKGLKKKDELQHFGELALAQITSGANEMKNGYFQEAFDNFSLAEEYFQEAEFLLAPILNQSSRFFEFYGDAETASNLIKFGQNISSAMKIFLTSIDDAKNFSTTISKDTNLLEFVENIENKIIESENHLISAKDLLTKIQQNTIANQIDEEIKTAELVINELIGLTKTSRGVFPGIKTLLGDRHPHTILFLFQNSHEIRANGGFIGSLLFVTLNDGIVVKTEFKDVFDLDSQLPDGVEPPEVFKSISKYWGLRDANYYPNFPDSAKKIQWFLEHEKHDSVDTIIAINEQIVEELLKITGPMNLPVVNEEVNSDNFSTILSFFVEAKIFGQNTPKKILDDFIGIFFEKINTSNPTKVINAVAKMAMEKHIYAYSFQQETQELFDELGISGRFEANKSDSLSILQTSISANKSDGFIDEQIYHNSSINMEGNIFNTVKITRNHNWGENEDQLFDNLFSKYGSKSLREKGVLRNILGAGKNLVWTRVYIPANSMLYEVDGITRNNVEVTQENGFTVISFFFPGIMPGENKSVEISFIETKKLDLSDGFAPYHFCFNKSAGISKHYLEKSMQLESGIEIIDNPDNIPFAGTLKTDECFSVLLGKESYLD